MKEKVDLTHEADLVLIYYQEKPAVYARVEAIEPDVKKGWFLVTLLLLTLPAQTVTWILRDEYISGEPYTMGGQSMRLEKVKRTRRGNFSVVGSNHLRNSTQRTNTGKSSFRAGFILALHG